METPTAEAEAKNINELEKVVTNLMSAYSKQMGWQETSEQTERWERRLSAALIKLADARHQMRMNDYTRLLSKTR